MGVRSAVICLGPRGGRCSIQSVEGHVISTSWDRFWGEFDWTRETRQTWLTSRAPLQASVIERGVKSLKFDGAMENQSCLSGEVRLRYLCRACFLPALSGRERNPMIRSDHL